MIKYRWAIIIILIAVIFVNWYYYLQVYNYIKVVIYKALIYIGLDSIFSAKAIEAVYAKGISIFLLALQNAALSLMVVYVYFKKDPKILRMGTILLFSYTFGCLCWSLTSYLMNWQYLYAISRESLDTLASPLIEASLIPILHLYQASLSQKRD
jgi:hypothetical protein